MKNKKGFTLIELLATITIMTIIATMASINTVKIFDEKEKSAKKREQEIIEASACVYIELNKNKDLKEQCLKEGCKISSNTLIKEGLLLEEDVDNETFIHITKKNNEIICTKE